MNIAACPDSLKQAAPIIEAREPLIHLNELICIGLGVQGFFCLEDFSKYPLNSSFFFILITEPRSLF